MRVTQERPAAVACPWHACEQGEALARWEDIALQRGPARVAGSQGLG